MTIVSPLPTRWPAPSSGSVPPIITVGSRPACRKICVIMDVVVVLPCVPETQTAFLYSRMMTPHACARSKTGMPAARAAAISGLSLWTAAVRMMQSAPAMFSARWPMATGMPLRTSSSVETDEFMSEPVIVSPLPRSTSPSGRMDTPPMPMR